MSKVSVAIYEKVDQRDAAHWAIWIEAPQSKNVILQVGDEKDGRGYYVDEPLNKRPDSSARLDSTILCGTISGHSPDDIIAIVQTRPVNNKSTTWNCQNWVLDGLQALEGQCGLQIAQGTKVDLEGRRENPKYENADAED